MKTYEFRARVTLDGVRLYAEAESEEEARKLIEAGAWSDEETGSASWADWSVGSLVATYGEE